MMPSEGPPSSSLVAQPPPKPSLPTDPLEAARLELAHRVLARRRLLPFVQKINPRYIPGWVHEDICRRLERFSKDVEEGCSPRLMLLVPPRHGKSELASRMFPPWHLGRCPDHEFIACSYNVSLAMSFSRKVKEVIVDPVYEAIFDTRLHPDFQAAEEWAIKGHRGGYVAAGVGGGITGKGAHCLASQTLVRTEVGPLAIERLYQLKSLPRVETPFGYKRVLAATKRPAPQLYTLRFASGAVLRATGEHPIYLPDRSKYVQVKELYGQAVGGGGSEVRVVRASVSTAPLRPREVCAGGLDGVLLREGVQPGAPRSEKREALCDVRQAGRSGGEEPGSTVLQSEVQAQPGAASAEVLPSMRRGVSAETFHAGLLRGELRQYGAHDPYAWGGELELSDGQRVRVLVRPDEATDPGQGQGLRSLYDGETPALPPHQRGPQRQCPGEPGDALQHTPHGAPQVCYDSLLVVERCSESPDYVYDLQVEEAGCFFAEGVLVGNCLLIDDPIKNAEEAQSADLREKLWEWYTSTAYTRLAPGGGVLIIQTWWHDDDLAGKIQHAMRADNEADQFEIVRYPAIAEHDEYLDPDTDQIVERPPLEYPDLKPLRLKGEALHPARYDIRSLNQIKRTLPQQWWSALYQQNPVPDEGIYFTKDMFRRGPAPRVQDCYVSIAFDFAISEKQQNDYTVGTVSLLDSDDVLHFVDRVRFKSADADYICKAIVGLCKKWHNPSLQLGLEDGQIYRALSAPLKREMARQRVYPSMQLLKPISDKQARARTLQGRMQQGLVSFSSEADWYDSMRTEMLRFPNGVHDDQVDSAAWNAIMAAGRQPPKKQQSRPMKSWKDRLVGAGNGTHMAA